MPSKSGAHARTFEERARFDGHWLASRCAAAPSARIPAILIELHDVSKLPDDRWQRRGRIARWHREAGVLIGHAGGQVIGGATSSIAAVWPARVDRWDGFQDLVDTAQRLQRLLSFVAGCRWTVELLACPRDTVATADMVLKACRAAVASQSSPPASRNFRIGPNLRAVLQPARSGTPTAPLERMVAPAVTATSMPRYRPDRMPMNDGPPCGRGNATDFDDIARSVRDCLDNRTKRALAVTGIDAGTCDAALQWLDCTDRLHGASVIRVDLGDFPDDDPARLARALVFSLVAACQPRRPQRSCANLLGGLSSMMALHVRDKLQRLLLDPEVEIIKRRATKRDAAFLVAILGGIAVGKPVLISMQDNWAAGPNITRFVRLFTAFAVGIQNVAVLLSAASSAAANRYAVAPLPVTDDTSGSKWNGLAAFRTALGPFGHIARVAALFENSIDNTVLAEITGMDGERISHGMAQLELHGVVRRDGRDGTFRFKDMALRAQLCGTIDRVVRDKLHLQIAAALQTRAGEASQLAAIASHLELAGDPRGAAEWHLKAGASADEDLDFALAGQCYRAAWRISRRGRRSSTFGNRGDTYTENLDLAVPALLGLARTKALRHGQAHPAVRAALEWALAQADRPGSHVSRTLLADIIIGLHESLRLRGDRRDLNTLQVRLEALATVAGPGADVHRALLRMKGMAAFHCGRLETAAQHLGALVRQNGAEGGQTATSRRDLAQYAQSCIVAAQVAMLRNREQEAAHFTEISLKIAENMREPSIQAHVLCCLGATAAWADQPMVSAAHANAARSIAQHYGFAHRATVADLLIGNAMRRTDPRRGLEVVTNALEAYCRLRSGSILPIGHYLAAQAALAARKTELSDRHIKTALRVAKANGAMTHMAEFLRVAAVIKALGAQPGTLAHATLSQSVACDLRAALTLAAEQGARLYERRIRDTAAVLDLDIGVSDPVCRHAVVHG